MPTFVIVIIILAAIALYYQATHGRGMEGAEQREAIKQAGIDFLAKNKTEEGVKETESGLQYKVLEEGTGTEHPTKKSRVKVHYEGRFLDGNVFDSSYKRGRPAVFGLNQVIKGWTEGVQLMKEGEKVRFVIPSKIAYGNRWQGNIPPNSTLIFDVELIEIIE